MSSYMHSKGSVFYVSEVRGHFKIILHLIFQRLNYWITFIFHTICPLFIIREKILES
jgi:hypothetical protein